MTTQLDVRTSPTWPLAATQEAHAHLTWTEWTARQAASVAHTQRPASASFTLDQCGVVAHLDRRTATRGFPGAHGSMRSPASHLRRDQTPSSQRWRPPREWRLLPKLPR